MDSVLWGIDGDWMVKYFYKNKPFYPTDHYGVLRVLTDKVHPRYVARVLEVEGRQMGFSRSYRASIDRVEGISFNVPPIEKQKEVVSKVMILENEISKLEEKLLVLDKQKTRVIEELII